MNIGDILRQIVALSDEQLAQITRLASARHFPKNAYLFTPHQPCTEVCILTQGLVRTFYVFNDKEINLRLLCENSAVMAFSSVILRDKTQEYVQALEPCEGLMFNVAELERLAHDIPEIYQLRIAIADRHYLAMERRLLNIQYKSAEERYQFFVDNMEPAIVARTPAIHVASYLGMTPESLSRIKRQLSRNQAEH